jgi:hypothetical protein
LPSGGGGVMFDAPLTELESDECEQPAKAAIKAMVKVLRTREALVKGSPFSNSHQSSSINPRSRQNPPPAKQGLMRSLPREPP